MQNIFAKPRIIMKTKLNKREYWLCALLMCIGIVAYNLLYFNNVYPVSEGWGIYYSELLSRGATPYLDFNYYLPPLNLLIDLAFWKLSFGYLIVFRAWYLLQRVVMMLFLYKLLTKWFKPRYVWISCLTGVCLGTSSVYDLVGDYNQTQTFLIILLAICVTGFLEKDVQNSKKTFSANKNIFWAGFILALMLLLKQSLGAAAIIVCFVFLLMYCLVFKDKKFWTYCLYTVLGALLPLLVFAIYLFATGAFGAFLEQFFGAAGAKGGLITILFGFIKNTLLEFSKLSLFFVSVLFVYALAKLLQKDTRERRFTFSLALLSFATVFLSNYGHSAREIMRVLINRKVFLLAFAVLVLLIAFLFAFRKKKWFKVVSAYNYSGPAALIFSGAIAFCVIDFRGAVSDFFDSTNLFHDFTNLINFFSIFFIIMFTVFCFVKQLKTGKMPIKTPLLALFLAGIVEFYCSSMASSGVPIPRMMFILVPIFFSMLFSLLLPKINQAKNLVLCFVCLALCFLCMTQKIASPYSWWGSKENWPIAERTEKSELKAFTGFSLPKQDVLEFDQVTKIIEENSDEDDTVWGFPHVKIFNILTDRYDLTDPVPVLFYDVCSDDAAMKELEWLEENNPEIIVWCDIPLCLESHEYNFRNGEELGQRKIIEWFEDARKEKYIKIGQVGNLFIYKLDDGTEPSYTYFQNKDYINITAGEKSRKKNVNKETL